jgi:DNA-binding NarL/FixJ family response regulator
MDDLANPAEPINGSQKLPAIAIIEDQVLARTCIVNILKRKITGFEIVEMATASHLNLLSGRDVRLIAFNIGDKQITDPSIEDRLALLEESCPNASIAAVVKSRRRGHHISRNATRGPWFFLRARSRSRSLSPDCGLFLPRRGLPLPIIRQNEATILRAMSEYSGAPELSVVHEGGGAANIMPEWTLADLTPREQHVLAALKLGLPTKLIAVRLTP